MARPQQHLPRTLDEAVAELRRDPSHPVHLVVDGIELELRLAGKEPVRGAADQSNLGDRIAALGPWQGESTDEVVRRIREAREGNDRTLPDLR